MSRIAALLTVAAFAAVMSSQPNSKAKNDKKASAPEGPPSVTFVNNYGSCANAENPNQNPPKWYTPLNRPDWWVVIIAGLTAGFIGYQALEMRHATEAMRAQSAHTVNAERPWVVLTIYAQSFRMQPADRLDWRISNDGRTVANIIECGLRCSKVQGMETILKSPPNYGSPIPFYGIPLAPQAHLDAWTFIEKDTGRGLNTVDVEEIRSKGHDLVAYGVVRYRDQFGQEHESRFCYYYAVPFQEFRINLRAPADYHRCT